MQETQVSQFKYILCSYSYAFIYYLLLTPSNRPFSFISCRYSFFWFLVLLSKFSFSYSFEVSNSIGVLILRSYNLNAIISSFKVRTFGSNNVSTWPWSHIDHEVLYEFSIVLIKLNFKQVG